MQHTPSDNLRGVVLESADGLQAIHAMGIASVPWKRALIDGGYMQDGR